MKKEIIINDKCFSTQKKAKDYTRELLLKLEPIGEIQPVIEGWDYLHALIKRHPRYESKKGKGIKSIIIKRNDNGGIAIHLERIDGTDTDISWYKCIEARTGSPEKKLKSAMRSAIQDQIDHFKSNALQSPLVCKICSKSIIATGDMHVHHNPPFAELAENFIRENSPPPTQFDENLTMREAQFTPASEEYSKRWQDYHHQYAKLEITHKGCNLRQPKKRETQILIPF